MDWFKSAPPAKAPPVSISLPSIPGISTSKLKLQLPDLKLPDLKHPYVVYGAASVGGLLLLGTVSSVLRSGPSRIIPSPVESKLPKLSPEEVAELPYPPDALPGARDVKSPYGTVRIYEWGPEDGDKILLIHGISTPGIAMADLAHKLVRRGCRVMMFGWSSSPLLAPTAIQFRSSIILFSGSKATISISSEHHVKSAGNCVLSV
jgi:hypothetical protein